MYLEQIGKERRAAFHAVTENTVFEIYDVWALLPMANTTSALYSSLLLNEHFSQEIHFLAHM